MSSLMPGLPASALDTVTALTPAAVPMSRIVTFFIRNPPFTHMTRYDLRNAVSLPFLRSLFFESSFYGTACQAGIDLLLEEKKDDQRRQQCQEHTGTDDVELRFIGPGERVKGGGDGVILSRISKFSLGNIVII